MQNCTHCKYADWKRTEAGRLHPSGGGTCRFEVKLPKLPVSMYWIFKDPRVGGGHINRRGMPPEHCPHFARKDN